MVPGGVESDTSCCGGGEPKTRGGRLRPAVAVCRRPEHLRRTIPIAIVVGVVLTAINQGSVLIAGHANGATWIRVALNVVVPFVVSNVGLLSAQHAK